MGVKTVTGSSITINDAIAGSAVAFSIGSIPVVQNGTPSESNYAQIVPYQSIGFTLNGRAYSLVMPSDFIAGDVNVTDGKAFKNHYLWILNGTESWNVNGVGTVNAWFYTTENDSTTRPSTVSGTCSRYIYRSINSSNTFVGFRFYDNTAGVRSAIRPNDAETYTRASLRELVLNWYNDNKPLEFSVPLISPIEESITALTVPLVAGTNTLSCDVGVITLQYNAQEYSITLPPFFSADIANPEYGDTVTLTYTGEIALDFPPITVTGNTTGDTYPFTDIGNNQFTIVMPNEDVTITSHYQTFGNVVITNTTGGTITADKRFAYQGDVITLTVAPNTNYELQSINVIKNGVSVPVTKVNDLTYTFTANF